MSTLKFLIFLLFLLIVIRLSFFYSQKLLNDYFNRQEVVVPNIVGMTFYDASKLMVESRLIINSRDEKYSNDTAPGRIIHQDPPAGQVVKASRQIDVTVSKGPQTVSCPDITGMSARNASLTITSSGFSVGVRSYINHDLPPDTVIAQNPAPYEEISPGSPIDMLLSLSGQEATFPMPVLTSHNLDAVKLALEQLKLKLGQTGYRETPSSPPGTVLSQKPEPGFLVSPGDEIDIIVARSPLSPANLTTNSQSATSNSLQITSGENPDSTNYRFDSSEHNHSQSTAKIEFFKFIMPPSSKIREAKIIVIDDTGAREVYRAMHAPTEEIDLSISSRGQRRILIYLDGVFFREE